MINVWMILIGMVVLFLGSLVYMALVSDGTDPQAAFVIMLFPGAGIWAIVVGGFHPHFGKLGHPEGLLVSALFASPLVFITIVLAYTLRKRRSKSTASFTMVGGCLSPDGKKVISVVRGWKEAIYLRNADVQENEAPVEHRLFDEDKLHNRSTPKRIGFSPDAKYLACVMCPHSLERYQGESGAQVRPSFALLENESQACRPSRDQPGRFVVGCRSFRGENDLGLGSRRE